MGSERQTTPVTPVGRRPGRPRTKPERTEPSKSEVKLMTTLAYELPLLMMEIDQIPKSPDALHAAARKRLRARRDESAGCAFPEPESEINEILLK